MMEFYCKHCPEDVKGSCCYHSVFARSTSGKLYNIILKNHPCKFLDLQTKKCLVYKNRKKVNPYCDNIDDALRRFDLPARCVYVKRTKNYPLGMTKIDHIPNDVTDEDRAKIEDLEKMDKQEFRTLYLPLII